LIDESIRHRFETIVPLLDERGLRRLAAAEATAAGRGAVLKRSQAPAPCVGTETPAVAKGLRIYLTERDAPPVAVPPPPSPRKYWTRRGIADAGRH